MNGDVDFEVFEGVELEGIGFHGENAKREGALGRRKGELLGEVVAVCPVGAMFEGVNGGVREGAVGLGLGQRHEDNHGYSSRQ